MRGIVQSLDSRGRKQTIRFRSEILNNEALIGLGLGVRATEKPKSPEDAIATFQQKTVTTSFYFLGVAVVVPKLFGMFIPSDQASFTFALPTAQSSPASVSAKLRSGSQTVQERLAWNFLRITPEHKVNVVANNLSIVLAIKFSFLQSSRHLTVGVLEELHSSPP